MKELAGAEKLLPICDDTKLTIYAVTREPWLDQYIYHIQRKYSYKDTVLLTTEEIVNHRLNRKYDILKTIPVPKEEFYRAFDKAEVLRYPKMSFIFNECVKDKFVRLYDLANYCKEYFLDEEFIEILDFCDSRNLISKSVAFGSREQSLTNRTIIRDIKNFPLLSHFDFFDKIGEFNFYDGRLLVGIENSAMDYELLQQMYYIGRANKEAIDYINDKYLFYWKKNKVKELKK